VADQALKLAQSLVPSQAAGTVWRFDLPEVQLVVDRDQIASALAELFRNSLECAAPRPVTINLTAPATGERLELAVTDDGPGVSKADAPHIFDPFFSGRPDKAGMGLTLAQEIVLEHNGSLALDAGYSGGARFVLTIPRFPSHLMSRLDEPGHALDA